LHFLSNVSLRSIGGGLLRLGRSTRTLCYQFITISHSSSATTIIGSILSGTSVLGTNGHLLDF
jgi:hypothetical protein